LLRKLLVLFIPILGIAAWVAVRGKEAHEVAFASVRRETLVSTLTTNGKVEPLQWASIRPEVGGPVANIRARRGENVREGEILLTITGAAAEAELATARSRIEQARAELDTMAEGGRAADVAEIESGLTRAKADLVSAQRELEITSRLVARKAATQAELTAAEQAVQKARLEIASLERRRASLVSEPDRRSAEARLQDARSSAAAASNLLAGTQVRSPLSGVLYAFEVHAGAFLTAGQEIGRVGKLSQLRVIVYVDEPELGRIAEGMPVTITWDALPGREWTGRVESVPLQVVSLGSRQVGEVPCTIENPDLSLIPGTNVNVAIRSQVVENALVVPKEALHREGQDTGVYKLERDHVVWQRITLGAASLTHVQATAGLSEGDRVALSTGTPLRNGDPVRVASR
jgi:HlyD family secretion protein